MLKDSIDTIDKLTVICFSPTRTSRKIAEAVAAGMNGTPGGTAGHAGASQQIRTIDLTLDRSDEPSELRYMPAGWLPRQYGGSDGYKWRLERPSLRW